MGFWRFVQAGDDLGHMLDQMDLALAAHIERFRPEAVVYEAPILVFRPGRHDTLRPLRKLYNLGGHLEWVCRRRGISCHEVTVKEVKKALAGFGAAEKADMVAAAEKIGLTLPPGKGREDAADAFGAWLLLLRAKSRTNSERFDRALYGRRGALL